MATIVVCNDRDRSGKGGIVGENDYRHLLEAMAKADGQEPKVVILTRYMSERSLFSYTQQNDCVEWDEDMYDAVLNERIQQLVLPHLGGSTLTDIKAVILPEAPSISMATISSEKPWVWLVERLADDAAVYQLRRCERGGSNWLEALNLSHYGGHLPAEKTRA